MNRRRFLQISGFSLAASSALWSCQTSSRQRSSSDGRPIAKYRRARDQSLRIACIGVGGRGLDNLNELLAECDAGPQPQFVEISALCDVDLNMLDMAATRIPNAKRYRDFRLLYRDIQSGAIEIDAVVISTPDHTHAFATAMALACGLPVYCEKPLTHTVAEARTIAAMARAAKVPTQMGTQIHAGNNYRTVVELIRSGAIGEVSSADCWDNRSWCCGQLTPGALVPASLDWDLWQGPTLPSPYIKDIAPANWRRYWKYGSGTLGDMACHILDLPFWALGLGEQNGLRAEIGTDGPAVDSVGCPASLEVSWALKWPSRIAGKDPLILRWFDGGKVSPTVQELSAKDKQNYGRFNTLFQGSKGFLLSNYDEHLILPGALAEKVVAPAPTLTRPAGHHLEWINAVRAWTMDLPTDFAMTGSNFQYASRLTELVLCGAVAYRSQGSITYDFRSGIIVGTNAKRATELMTAPSRDGWALDPNYLFLNANGFKFADY